MNNPIFRRSALVAGGLLVTAATLSQGCLQRDVNPQQPNTSNIFVEQVANTAINEIDLLFVIDNSVSMADKQEILVNAVPQMVERLVNPWCVNNNEDEEDTQPATDGVCAAGYSREFNPIEDIHIGVISSSLGGHGSDSCPRNDATWNNDDRGRLVATMRPDENIPMSDPAGFLAWTGGTQSSEDLINDFKAQVAGVGEIGCGFEAPLEAWYRFLVDPQPPEEIVVFETQAQMITDAEANPLVDGVVLQQRAAFLRPEGLVAIVVLTDENDCSIMDGGDQYNNAGYGWLIASPAETGRPMKIATPMCDTNPNDKCCFSCLQAGSPPDGCSASVCEPEPAPTLALDQDRANARCFQNKRRFGVDLLYPTQRYVDALTLGEIVDARTGVTVPNPLLRGAGFDDAPAGTPDNRGRIRPPGLVFFAGIVGIPWQDIATQDSLDNAGTMEYLTADDLLNDQLQVNGAPVNRWEIILGQPGLAQSSERCDGDGEPACGNAPVLPLDPFMIESIVERTPGLVNPISGDMIVDSTSNNPRANNINGHEANHEVLDNKFGDGAGANDDLQYACTFPLETPKDDCQPGQLNCDCDDEGTLPHRNRPLCQPPAGGAAGTSQYYGKAYPGTRILQVLRDFGENSIVGSICPKIALTSQVNGNLSDPNYGYNPAVQAIVDRLKEKLTGKCLPRELSIDEDGSVPCSVVEAKPPNDGTDPDWVALDCGADGRDIVDEDIRPAVLKQLESTGRCGEGSAIKCDDYEMCTIVELPLDTEGRDTCLTNVAPPDDGTVFTNAGFCYIDPAKQDDDGKYIAGGGDDGTNPLVETCPATERRLLRFVGTDTPAKNTITFVACTGDAASADAPIPPPATPDTGMGGGGI